MMNGKITVLILFCLLLAPALACGGAPSPPGEEPIPIEQEQPPPEDEADPEEEDAPPEEPAAEEGPEETSAGAEDPLEDADEQDSSSGTGTTSVVYTPDNNPCLRDVFMPCMGCGGGGGEMVVYFEPGENSSAVVARLPVEGYIYELAFAGPAGDLIGTQQFARDITITDVNSGAEFARLNRDSGLYYASYNSELGLVAASDGEGKIWLWDLTSSDPEDATLIVDVGVDEHGNPKVREIALSPDGRYLAVAEAGFEQGEPFYMASSWGIARVFDVAGGEEINRFEGEFISEMSSREIEEEDYTGVEMTPAVMQNGHAGPINWLAFSPDSQTLFTANYQDYTDASVDIHGTGSTLRVWDIATGEHLRCLETGDLRDPTDPALSPDGLQIATEAGGKISIWDVNSSAVDRQFGLPVALRMEISELLFDATGQSVITSVTDEQAARIWNAENGRLRGLLRHPGSVEEVAPSPDGRHVATTTGDEVWVWDSRNAAIRRAAAAQMLVDSGLAAAKNGVRDEMQLAFEEAQSLTPDDGVLLRPEIWEAACHLGILAGEAPAFLDTCDHALAKAQEAGYGPWILAEYHDSRGIARALSGEYQGAIEDFTLAAEAWSYTHQGDLRESWIETLSEGSNPIDEAALQALRGQ